jgi:hypothetical protein
MDWLALPVTNAIPYIELLVGRRVIHRESFGSRYAVALMIEWMFWFFYHAIPIFYVSRWLIVARDRRQRGVCVICGGLRAAGTGQCLSCNPAEQEQSTLVQTIAPGENHDSATGATTLSE